MDTRLYTRYCEKMKWTRKVIKQVLIDYIEYQLSPQREREREREGGNLAYSFERECTVCRRFYLF